MSEYEFLQVSLKFSLPPPLPPPHSIQKSTLESGISYFKNIIIITITALATFIIGTLGLLNKNVS